MVIDSNAADIVCSDHFTGVKGNYLRGSILRAGLDPDTLGATTSGLVDLQDKAKAWRDVWGCGQGIGTITATRPAAEIIADLVGGYAQTRDRLCEKEAR